MLIIKYFHKLRPLRTPIFQPKGKLKKKYISKNPLWNFETPSEHQANDLLGDKIRFLFNISFPFSQNTQVHKIKFIFKKRRKPLISPIHTKTVSTIISETFSPSIFFIVDDYRWENEEKKNTNQILFSSKSLAINALWSVSFPSNQSHSNPAEKSLITSVQRASGGKISFYRERDAVYN